MKNQWSLVSYAYEKSKPLILAHNYTAIMRTRTDVFFTRRYGMVWYGVVWYSVVWCGVVRCGVVWCGVVWCGVV